MKHLYYRDLITQSFIFFLIFGATSSNINAEETKNKDSNKILKEIKHLSGKIDEVEKKVKHIDSEVEEIENIAQNIQNNIGDCYGITICSELEDINDKIGNCNVCSTLEVIDSKIDTLNPSSDCDVCSLLEVVDSKIDTLSPSNCDLSAIESIIENINDKIGSCSLCDEFIIVNSKIDLLEMQSIVMLSLIEIIIDSIC